jgi:hypothetical protein
VVRKSPFKHLITTNPRSVEPATRGLRRVANREGIDSMDDPETPDARAELKVKKVPLSRTEAQPVKGDGESVDETKMVLPLSDPDRLLTHHTRIETVLKDLALRENISIEAAYKWAGDMLEHFSNLTKIKEMNINPGFRWGRIILVLIFIAAAVGITAWKYLL